MQSNCQKQHSLLAHFSNTLWPRHQYTCSRKDAALGKSFPPDLVLPERGRILVRNNKAFSVEAVLFEIYIEMNRKLFKRALFQLSAEIKYATLCSFFLSNFQYLSFVCLPKWDQTRCNSMCSSFGCDTLVNSPQHPNPLCWFAVCHLEQGSNRVTNYKLGSRGEWGIRNMSRKRAANPTSCQFYCRWGCSAALPFLWQLKPGKSETVSQLMEE